MELPPEIEEIIAEFISDHTLQGLQRLINFCATNSYLNNLCNDDNFWKRVYQQLRPEATWPPIISWRLSYLSLIAGHNIQGLVFLQRYCTTNLCNEEFWRGVYRSLHPEISVAPLDSWRRSYEALIYRSATLSDHLADPTAVLFVKGYDDRMRFKSDFSAVDSRRQLRVFTVDDEILSHELIENRGAYLLEIRWRLNGRVLVVRFPVRFELTKSIPFKIIMRFDIS